MNMTGCRPKTAQTLQREPRLREMLNDPVVKVIMLADGVSPASWFTCADIIATYQSPAIP